MQKEKSKSKTASTRIVGITAIAKELNISRNHLWRVVKGLRKSPKLLKRYHDQRRKLKKLKSLATIK